MPSSVSSPDDLQPSIHRSSTGDAHRLRRPCPGLRAAAVLAVMGGLAGGAQAQETFDGEAGTGSDFDDITNWIGDLYPGDDFAGAGIIFDLPDLDPFDILVGGGITGLGGLDNTVDNVDITFDSDSNDPGSFTFDPGAVIDTGTGTFTFNLGVTFEGDVLFTLNDTGAMTFTEAVVFGIDDGAGGVATFDSGSGTFAGDVTLWDDYDLAFDNGAAIAFGNVAFQGTNHDLIFNDTLGGGTFAEVVFGGDVSFVDGATLTVTGPTEGTAVFNGEKTMAGAFTLLVDGDQTVEFTGVTEFGGAVTINTVDGVAGGPGGDATVSLGGNFNLGSGIEELLFEITTDGTNDSVSIAGSALRGITSRFIANDGSAFRFTGGSTGDGNTHVELSNGSTVQLGITPGTANEFLFESLNDHVNDAGDPIDGTSMVELDGDEDAQAFIRGGTYSGGFSDTGDGDLSIAWTRAESRYLGTADIDGAYQARNEALHYLGAFDTDVDGDDVADTIRASVTGLSAFEIIQGTAYLENADVSTAGDGTFTMSSGATASALLMIENDSTLSVGADFTMDADSVIMITGNADSGVNLDVLGQSTIEGAIEITATSAGTANASFGDATTLNGMLNQSSSSFVTFGNDLAIQVGAQWMFDDTATGNVDGDLTVAGLLALEGEDNSGLTVGGSLNITDGGQVQIVNDRTMSIGGNLDVAGLLSLEGDAATGLTVGDSVTIANGGQVQVIDDRRMNVISDFTVEDGGTLLFEDDAALVVGRDFFGNGTIQFRNRSAVDVVGTWTQSSGTAVFDGPAMFDVGSLVIEDGASIELRDSGGSTTAVVVTNGNVDVQSGGLLFGNATIDIQAGDLEYGGVVMAGANGASEGRLEMLNGNLVAQDGGELRFGLTGGMAGAIGESSLISITNGVADFSNSGSIVVDVIGTSYIPTNQTFTLVEATDFVNAENIDVQANQASITRSWNFGVEDDAGALDRIFAQSDADYTNTLTGEQLQIGNLLNSFINPANGDPEGAYGLLLGELDQIQTASAYSAAIAGLEPTAQISAIQVSALGQYHDVLRQELRQQYVAAERRTTTPFRLGAGDQLLSADDTTVQRSVRRTLDPESSARGFAGFWGRSLTTPNEGDVVGLEGKEYGGFGAFAWDLSDAWIAGVDLGYSAFTGNLRGGYGDTRIGTVRGGGFASWSDGSGLFVDGALSAAWNHYDFTRSVPGTSLSAESNADGWQVDVSVGSGYRIDLQEGFAFTPQASFLYSYISTGSIDENSNSVAALSIDPGELSSFIGRVGGGVSWNALPGLIFDGELGWQGNFTDNGDYSVGLSGLGADVPVEVKNQVINTAYYGAGVSWAPTSRVSVNFNWQGRSGEGLRSQMLFGGVSIEF